MLHSYYSEKIVLNQRQIERIKPKCNLLVGMKLLFFCCFAVMAYVWFMNGTVLFPCLTLLFLGAYIITYRLGMHYDECLEYHKNIDKCYKDELAYLNRDYSRFESGNEFIDSSHEYSFDLDIFGVDSFFHRINRTVTLHGSLSLASLLTVLPCERNTVIRRQNALTELTANEEWGTRFRALGANSRMDISHAIRALRSNRMTNYFNSRFALAFLYISLIIMVLLITLTIFNSISALWWITWFMVQLLFSSLYMRTLFRSTSALAGLHCLFARYRKLMIHIAGRSFQSNLLCEKQQALTKGTHSAIVAIDKLSKLISQLDSRNNIMGTLLCNGFFLRDLFLIRSYNQWVTDYLQYFPIWMKRLGEFDALISLANYQFNHPKNVVPVISESPENGFVFEGLYHPFLSEDKATGNNLILPIKQFAIVTGANMAGKSTFLRSIGVNYIMAMNGLNVCASSFHVPVVALFSSMRTTDNLAKNISYFNSELLRLEQLINFVYSHNHTFIILDEILKGTNSADKLNGARLFLQKMTQLSTTGIIATHDLELSKLEAESDCFVNYCFEIELNEVVTYSYLLTSGVAKNMNASYLLNRILSRINT